MAIRNILVHVNDQENNDEVIRASIQLAQDKDAALTGLYVRPYPIVVPVAPIGGAMPVIDGMIEAYQEACNAAKKRFTDLASRSGVAHAWYDDDGDAAERIGVHARYTDLAVIGQISSDNYDGQTPRDLPAVAAMTAGRPVLSIPFAGSHAMTFKRVMLCWNGSREATRALHDAISLLAPATHIDVACFDASDRDDRDPGADIAAHIAHHGFKADAHRMVSGELNTVDAILSASSDLGSDLIVMGAYGHTRIREIAMGGVTRGMMEHMPVPVLMSH
jgi:nucleotide-binding universal stress UspA family protein